LATFGVEDVDRGGGVFAEVAAMAHHSGTSRVSQDEGEYVMATPRRSDRPGLLLWLNTAARLRNRLLTLEAAGEEITVRPEDTLRAAGISSRRQARYQRRMSSLLAGKSVMAATQTRRAN
jgi:hypothetical protein